MLIARFKQSCLALMALLSIGMGVANAQDAQRYAGTWVMQIEGKNLLVLTLADSNGDIQGYMDLPAKLGINNSIFNIAKNGDRRDKVVKSRLDAHALHLSIQNANDPSDVNNVNFTIKGNTAVMAFEDLPPGYAIGPWPFERATSGATVAQDWELNRSYVLGDANVESKAMAALYAADQQDRSTQPIDWRAVAKRDATRRAQTRQLMRDGQLHAGKDFEEAAFIFQHGDAPDDYLLAHTLALIAIAKGQSTALWISAASLDRYLQSIKQPQIYGTQFNGGSDGVMTQQPYNSALISDALRQQMGVPSQATQSIQLKSYQKQ